MMSKDMESGTGPSGHGLQGNRRWSASVLTLLLIALPRLAIQMATSVEYAALGPYLGTMLPDYIGQVTQFIGLICAIFVSPLIGIFSDRSVNKWGRRRSFLLFAAIASVVCWILMGYTREIGEALGDYGNGQPDVPTSRTWTTVVTIALYAWMNIAISIVETPTFLLIADFAGERQTLAAAIGQGWSLVGSILVVGYIHLFGAAHRSLHWFLGMILIAMMVTVVIACIAGREAALEKDAKGQVKGVFASIIHALKKFPSTLLVYYVVFFCVCYGFTVYTDNKVQFFDYEVFDGDASGADDCGAMCTNAQDEYNEGVSRAGSANLLFNIVGYLFSWVLPFLVKTVGTKWVLVFSLIPQSLLMIMAFSKVVAVDVAIGAIASVTQTAMLSLAVPFFSLETARLTN